MSGGRRHAPFVRFQNLLKLDHITHAVTTRHGPAFGQVGTDQATVRAAAETAELLHMNGTAWAHQVHGNTILQAHQPGLVGQADGLVTDAGGLLIAGRSADCPIILLTGQRNDGTAAVGFAHASWRSTVEGITGILVDRLAGDMGCLPRTMTAAIAPSAGPCCYEVGEEVRDQAMLELGSKAVKYFLRRDDSWFFNLWSANLGQLLDGGVPQDQVENLGICTICAGDDFWSWRTQGPKAGRFAAIIGISQGLSCQIPPSN